MDYYYVMNWGLPLNSELREKKKLIFIKSAQNFFLVCFYCFVYHMFPGFAQYKFIISVEIFLMFLYFYCFSSASFIVILFNCNDFCILYADVMIGFLRRFDNCWLFYSFMPYVSTMLFNFDFYCRFGFPDVYFTTRARNWVDALF